MDALGLKDVMFIVLAVAAVATSLMMVTRKNPVHSALWMIAAFFTMAVIYLLLNAQFIAVAQVMVYAGAIMMLILFVIMLVHMETGGEGGGTARRSKATRIAGALITAI
ncbi:MAG: NADH-quinone oxidoreductase subunit J, partial [Proteobacteria bacterium]|nr:NADH-quinone oxidoreductase subunit J [Pseudomonadota bacterium]